MKSLAQTYTYKTFALVVLALLHDNFAFKELAALSAVVLRRVQRLEAFGIWESEGGGGGH